jgi:hypothetical protein
MAGMTMSPQLRESPETANFQERPAGFCAVSEQAQRRISQKMRRIKTRL